MRFPVSVLGNEVYEVYLRKFTQKDALITLEDQSGEHQKKEPEIPEIPGSGVITLDGYFEDWDKIFHRPITYGSWNGTGVHNGALYIDDDVAYVHITMNDQYGAQMPLNAMTLKINGSAGSVQFSANYRDENYQNKWSGKVYNMDQGISSGLAIFNDNYPQVYLGDAYFHVYTSDHSRGDEYEFAISLKTVSQLTGIPIESMTQFELHLPNIGNAIIASYGSSTNPYLYVGVCLASVGLGSIYYRRRKRVVA